MTLDMLEAEIENHLRKQCKALNLLLRKVKWIGRRGAPDDVLIGLGNVVFLELKKKGEKPKPHQQREINRMRLHGAWVETLDSIEAIDNLLEKLCNSYQGNTKS